LMSMKELIREARPLGVISDKQYIEALEFNGDGRKGTKILPKILPDYFLQGPNYSLSGNNKIMTKTGSNGYNATCITECVSEGVWKWSLKILNTHTDSTPYIMIGIAPQNINQSASNNYSSSGWYFYCYNSKLYSGPPFSYSNKYYSNTEKLKVGDIVDVELNIPNKTIKFYVNVKDCGVAYNGIPVDQPLRLAILPLYTNESVELLSVTQL